MEGKILLFVVIYIFLLIFLKDKRFSELPSICSWKSKTLKYIERNKLKVFFSFLFFLFIIHLHSSSSLLLLSRKCFYFHVCHLTKASIVFFRFTSHNFLLKRSEISEKKWL